jgi:hypothetical protein
MRDIYVRQRPRCKYASIHYKHPKGLPARLVFGCGYPIYPKVQLRHTDPSVAPFEFNSSLAKLGIHEKLAAEELIDQWAVHFLSGQNTSIHPDTFRTVEQAVTDYLQEKRGTLDPKKESSRHTLGKSAGILNALAAFLKELRILYSKT